MLEPMETSLKPQPLIGEVLPGFALLCIVGTAFLTNHPGTFAAIIADRNTAEVIAGGIGLILIAWITGTIFDTTRDVLEHLLDHWFPINWQFLFRGPTAEIRKLDDGWLAYYFLSGNSSLALIPRTAWACSQYGTSAKGPWCFGPTMIPPS